MDTTLLTVMSALGAVGGGGRELAKAIGLGSAGQVALAVLLGCVLLKVGRIGLAVWLEANFAKPIDDMVDLYRNRAGKCVLVGLIDLIAGLFVVALLLGAGPLGGLGLILFVCLVALAALGFAAAYLNLGRKLAADGAGDSPTRLIVKGGVTAEAAFLVPILGQLLELGMLFRGMGAAALVILARTLHKSDAAPEDAA